MPKTPQVKRAYAEATGKSPIGPAFEAWLERKTGGDYSDSNMDRVFGGGGDPTPLKRGEKTIPEKRYESETKPARASVKIGHSKSERSAAIERVKANMQKTTEERKRFAEKVAENNRRKRGQSAIESY